MDKVIFLRPFTPLLQNLPKRLPIFFELSLPHTRDGQHGLQGRRPLFNHIHQRPIVKNDVGRQVVVLGNGKTQGFEGLEEVTLGVVR